MAQRSKSNVTGVPAAVSERSPSGAGGYIIPLRHFLELHVHQDRGHRHAAALAACLGARLLYKDGGRVTRTARALTVRVALSISLFVLLMTGFYFGLIPPGLTV
jgi:hypothetical protein